MDPARAFELADLTRKLQPSSLEFGAGAGQIIDAYAQINPRYFIRIWLRIDFEEIFIGVRCPYSQSRGGSTISTCF